VTETEPTPHRGQDRAGSALSLDSDAYRPMLADAGMTREQETQFLEALWAIMVGFVDLGFGRDPVQLTMDVSKRSAAVAGPVRPVISCADTFNKKSNSKSARPVRRATGKKDS